MLNKAHENIYIDDNYSSPSCVDGLSIVEEI